MRRNWLASWGPIPDPSERPFLTPWTEGSARDGARSVLRGHWGQLAGWSTRNWRLGLGVFGRHDGTAVVVGIEECRSMFEE